MKLNLSKSIKNKPFVIYEIDIPNHRICFSQIDDFYYCSISPYIKNDIVEKLLISFVIPNKKVTHLTIDVNNKTFEDIINDEYISKEVVIKKVVIRFLDDNRKFKIISEDKFIEISESVKL